VIKTLDFVDLMVGLGCFQVKMNTFAAILKLETKLIKLLKDE
jgi:hypothetical protein